MKLLGLVGLQLLASAVIIVPAVLAFTHYRAQLKYQVEQDLLAVAEVKDQQITDFLKERISDVEVIVQRAGIWMLVDPEVRRVAQGLNMSSSITEITRQLRNAYGYGTIAVFDANLQPVYPRHGDHSYDDQVLDALKKASQTGSPQIVDLHFHEEEQIHFGVVHPIRASGALEGPVIGMAFIEMPAHPNLYRLAASWPTTPSKTGESFLVRRDNDRITYLSPLRHDREMRPLRMQRPLETKNLLVAKAIREQFGVVQNGIDYRGVAVLGAALTITGTPWVVVAKIDEAEAYAGIARLGKTIAALAACFIVIAGIAIYYLWRNHAMTFEVRQSALERALNESSDQIKTEKELSSRMEANFAGIFDASPLPKQIHSLRNLHITTINRAHTRMFGYTLDEISDIEAWMEKVYPDPEVRDGRKKGWIADIEKIRSKQLAICESPEMRMHCRDGKVQSCAAA
jgi:PAS domain-containing protein